MGKSNTTLLYESWAKITTAQPKPSKSVYGAVKTLGFHLPIPLPPSPPASPFGAASHAVTHVETTTVSCRDFGRRRSIPHVALLLPPPAVHHSISHPTEPSALHYSALLGLGLGFFGHGGDYGCHLRRRSVNLLPLPDSLFHSA